MNDHFYAHLFNRFAKVMKNMWKNGAAENEWYVRPLDKKIRRKYNFSDHLGVRRFGFDSRKLAEKEKRSFRKNNVTKFVILEYFKIDNLKEEIGIETDEDCKVTFPN